jgi:two-component system response regulator TctD
MLRTLLGRAGQAVTKERLFELVFPGQAEVQFEAIEVVAYRLRKKLQGTGATLTTLRGLGYLLKLDATPSELVNTTTAPIKTTKPRPAP